MTAIDKLIDGRRVTYATDAEMAAAITDLSNAQWLAPLKVAVATGS
jgi:hypothetical protein